MSLRLAAEKDLGRILEDDVAGFGWPIFIIDPDGNSGTFTGYSDDIAQVIDPDTGQAVSGRLASVAVRISSLIAQGFKMPRGIIDASLKPWIAIFEDVNGVSYEFKVAQSNPDRALGLLTLVLEAYKS